jgi:hypothetical protein
MRKLTKPVGGTMKKALALALLRSERLRLITLAEVNRWLEKNSYVLDEVS